MKNNICLSFFLLIIILSCQPKQPTASNSSKISFPIDSLKIYFIPDKISVNHFVFSPIHDADKIWTVNGQNINELDLLTGDWVSLSKVYDQQSKKYII